MFTLESAFELIVIGMALIHSKFSRLPLLVIVNILAYTTITTAISHNFDITVSPAHEIYYSISGIYFAAMAWIFASVRNTYYLILALCLLAQSFFSFIIPVADFAQVIFLQESIVFNYTDTLYNYHEWVNSKVLVIECICVWLSALSYKDAR